MDHHHPLLVRPDDWQVVGPARRIRLHGRDGILPTSLRTRLSTPQRNLNAPRGSLRLWFAALDDLTNWSDRPWFHQRISWGGSEVGEASAPHPQVFPLISDHPEPRQWTESSFAAFFNAAWYPQLVVKWYKGNIYPDAFGQHQQGGIKGYCGLGHYDATALRWIHLAAWWDEASGEYALAVDGVLVQRTSTFVRAVRDAAGPMLYAGDPTIIIGDLRLSDAVIADPLQTYREDGGDRPDPDFQRINTGAGLPRMELRPGVGWRQRLAHSLREDDVPALRIEGMTDVCRRHPDGLEVTTSATLSSQSPKPVGFPPDEPPDATQTYLWLPIRLEGDILVQYDFMPLQLHGLSLLMTCAAGLHGEDHQLDHRPRVSGSMRQVCWDEVRNYHWEYYRQMEDCRTDVASSVLVKNPWNRPLAYQVLPERLAVGVWHRLAFRKAGTRIIGTLDEQVIFDLEDDAHQGNGPVLHGGRVAIRLMAQSSIRFRNLTVWDHPADSLQDRP